MPRKIKREHVPVRIVLPYDDAIHLKTEAVRREMTLGDVVGEALRIVRAQRDMKVTRH